jgi:acyl-CoA thioester hydrolase
MNTNFIGARLSLLPDRRQSKAVGIGGTEMATHEQRIFLRVYYEDTDFSGRVYHASYLRFFERGRTEWLRGMGLRHGDLAKSLDLAFAVVQLQVAFKAAAEIDDLLVVATDIEAVRGPLLVFQQSILRDDRTLVTGQTEVVTLKRHRPTRPPKEILAALGNISYQSRDRSVR